ncbi:MAG: SEC-C metal-binding domain-containing protein [Candidatus Acidiferrales bacterium]|jgi:uncharacterized protein YchJ
MKINIHPSVTPEQLRDPRFQKLLRDAEVFFNSPKNDNYKLMLGLHEAGHAYFARRSGATNIRHYGPKMIWDSRPQYDCPAISKSSTAWTPAPGGSIVDSLKANIGGYICRRKLSDDPNDQTAIEMDLYSAREWFDKNVGTGDEAFKAAIAEAEAEILVDLKSESVVAEIWDAANRFVKEVFQSKHTPKMKTKSVKVGRNEVCPCGSGRKFKRCCIDRLSQELRAA